MQIPFETRKFIFLLRAMLPNIHFYLDTSTHDDAGNQLSEAEMLSVARLRANFLTLPKGVNPDRLDTSQTIQTICNRDYVLLSTITTRIKHYGLKDTLKSYYRYFTLLVEESNQLSYSSSFPWDSLESTFKHDIVANFPLAAIHFSHDINEWENPSAFYGSSLKVIIRQPVLLQITKTHLILEYKFYIDKRSVFDTNKLNELLLPIKNDINNVMGFIRTSNAFEIPSRHFLTV